jgi:flagellar protein FlaF
MNRASVYQELERETLEGRELEASVLFRGARKLNICAQEWENGHTAEFQEKLAEALEYNQRLWSFLQVEISNPTNPLPETVRLNLLRLSQFIDKRVFALYAGGATAEDLLAIARVNEQIGKGLQAQSGGALRDESEENDPPVPGFLDIAG